MVPRVEVKWDEEFRCYDVVVRDPGATVADYEEGFGRLAAGEVRRAYAPSCLGCSLCCRGRLPLTSLDVARFQAGGVGTGLSWREWVRRYATVRRAGKCFDITLRLSSKGVCLFWDEFRGLCGVYSLRPLICRTYFCWPVSWRAEQLRSRIVNTGEDELVRLSLFTAAGSARQRNPFAGKRDYRQVLLRDLCSRRLWRILTSDT